MSNNRSVGLLVQGMSQSRLKMAKISYFSIEIQLSFILDPWSKKTNVHML